MIRAGWTTLPRTLHRCSGCGCAVDPDHEANGPVCRSLQAVMTR